MRIDAPAAETIPQLRQLWKLAFGDEDAFLDCFFGAGFSPERCRCVTIGEEIAAVLYWFDARFQGQKLAYLYGVATHPAHQGKGLCRALMDNTHSHLAVMGYDSVLLVPQKEGLRAMYKKMGYRDCTSVAEFFCTDDPYALPIHAIDCAEYARLRREYLPEGGVVQEGSNLAFLNTYAKFYKGMDFLLAAAPDEGSLFGMELLGNRAAAPGILCALGYPQGTFRTPGDKKPFAMFLPLHPGAVPPDYFGLAFD